jgi:hypothetical protein
VSGVTFSLGGLGFELRPGEKGVVPCLPAAFGPFQTARLDSPPTASYSVCAPTSNALLPADATRLLWDSPTWRLGETKRGDLAIEIHAVRDDRWHTVANLSADFSAGLIRPLAGRQADPSPFALNYPYDQALLTNRMVHGGAGVIHACGVVVDGKGLVFAGRSGVGKTTLARLWRDAGATLLNDDRVILRVDRGRVVGLWASPWHGDETEVHAETAPLCGIFHLRQAPVNRLQRITETEALTSLLATTVAPFYSASAMNRVVDLWSEVVQHVPSYSLEFTPDTRALDACRREIIEAPA